MDRHPMGMAGGPVRTRTPPQRLRHPPAPRVLPRPVPRHGGGRPADAREVIGSAIVGDFRPLTATGKFWILCDLLNGRGNELAISPQGLWARTFFRPGKNARDVAARLRGDDDFHRLIRSWQVVT